MEARGSSPRVRLGIKGGAGTLIVHYLLNLWPEDNLISYQFCRVSFDISAGHSYTQCLPNLSRTSSYCGLTSHALLATAETFIDCFEEQRTLADWETCMEIKVSAERVPRRILFVPGISYLFARAYFACTRFNKISHIPFFSDLHVPRRAEPRVQKCCSHFTREYNMVYCSG